MDKPYVCHVSQNIPGAVYIGRANRSRRLARSKWANPFVIDHKEGMERDDVVEAYRMHLTVGLGEPLLDDLHELTGKPLACWCRRHDVEPTLDNQCHGDILIELWRDKYE